MYITGSPMLFHVLIILILLLQPEVGLVAVNDAFILESMVYQLIQLNFKDEKFYVNLVDLFHQVNSLLLFAQFFSCS